MPKGNLEGDLQALLNSYSLENKSNTPDFILAQYLLDCLEAYDRAIVHRAEWYGRIDIPGRGSVPFPPPGYTDTLEGPIDVDWS